MIFNICNFRNKPAVWSHVKTCHVGGKLTDTRTSFKSHVKIVHEGR